MDIFTWNTKRSKITFFAVLASLFLSLGLEAATQPIEMDWTSSLKSGRVSAKKKLTFSTPLVVGERAYVGNEGGFFYSINTVDGKKIWEIKLEGPVQSRPLMVGNTLYIGDGKGEAYSIDSATGTINWHAFVGEEMMTEPVSNSDMVFFATQNNSLAALDMGSGAIRWMARRPQPFAKLAIKGFSRPTLIGNNIYVGNTDGVLVVYDAKSGNKVRTIPIAVGRAQFSDIDTSPLQYDNFLYFSSMEGVLQCMNYKTSKDVWSIPLATPNDIVVDNGELLVSGGGKLYSINAADGKINWETNLEVSELSGPAITGDKIVVLSTDDKIYLIDRASGAKIFERHLGGGTYGTPIVADGRVLVLSNSGQLYAFRIKN